MSEAVEIFGKIPSSIPTNPDGTIKTNGKDGELVKATKCPDRTAQGGGRLFAKNGGSKDFFNSRLAKSIYLIIGTGVLYAMLGNDAFGG